MTKTNKLVLPWLAGGAALLVLFAALFLIFISGRIVNSEAVKEKILTNLSQKLGGDITVRRIGLEVLPRPGILLTDVYLAVPGPSPMVSRVDALTVYPRILPLFGGRVRLGAVRAESPVVDIRVSSGAPKGAKVPLPSSLSHLRREVFAFLKTLSTALPDLSVTIAEGTLLIRGEERAPLRIEQIEGDVIFPPEDLEFDLSCSSDIWDELSFRGKIDAKTFEGAGKVELKRFDPQAAEDFLFKPPILAFDSSSPIDLLLTFETRLRTLSGQIEGSLPHVVLHPNKDRIPIRGGTFKGEVHIGEHEVTAFLEKADFDNPKVSISGRFLLDRTAPLANLEMMVTDAEVAPIREVILAAAGKYRTFWEIFKRLRGGKVPRAVISVRGKTTSEWRKLDHVVVYGDIEGGTVSLPDFDLDLEDVWGHALISEGILDGHSLTARHGGSHARDGTLTIGLRGRQSPVHLRLPIEADLSQMPLLLEKFVKDETFLTEMRKTEDVRGKASGRLIVTGTLASVRVGVDVGSFDLKARYGPIPYPIEAQGGGFSYDGEAGEISARGLTARVGSSSFSNLSGSLGIKSPHPAEVTSSRSVVHMGEIYGWLRGVKSVAPTLRNLKSLEGTLAMEGLSLKGPLQRPGEWRLESVGKMRDLRIHGWVLPAPLQVKRGTFERAGSKTSFTASGAKILDANLMGSGVLRGDLLSLKQATLTLQGNLGEKALERASELVSLPPLLDLRPPFVVSRSNLVWKSGNDSTFSGRFTKAKGPEVTLDLVLRPGETVVKKVLVRDEVSHASFSMNLGRDAWSFGFEGYLYKQTLDRLFKRNLPLDGWVKGNWNTRIYLKEPHRSRAEGVFEGRGISFPLKGVPVKIADMAVRAEEERIRVISSNLTWGEAPFSLRGEGLFSPEGFNLNADLSAERLRWEAIRPVLGQAASKGGDVGLSPFEGMPLRGRVNFKTNSFQYGAATWSPVHAIVSFDPAGVNVEVAEANICGISTPGTLKSTSQGMILDLRMTAENRDIEPVISCLGRTDRLMTGRFELDGRFTGQGKPEDLLRNLSGKAEFKAEDGRIYQLTLLSKVFAFLNLTEIFRGKLPDLVKEGFGYKSAKAEGELKGGRLELREVVIDGRSMEIAGKGDIDLIDKTMDFTVLVAPLKTLDKIIQYIPILGYIFKGHVISIPVGVSGPLNDPAVTPLPPAAVGSELLGIIKRTLTLPIKIIQPFLPNNEGEDR